MHCSISARRKRIGSSNMPWVITTSTVLSINSFQKTPEDIFHLVSESTAAAMVATKFEAMFEISTNN